MKMERIYIYLIVFAVVFIILKVSSFGWQSFRSGKFEPQRGGNHLEKILKNHVFVLSEKIGDRSMFNYEKLKKAAAYISEQFRKYGYEVEYQEYGVHGKAAENIVVTKKGEKKPKEVIIIGAHYDSCFNPGADDNASAVAGLLELARLMVSEKIDRTIKFIAFVNEEPPFFKTEDMGSRVYAREAKTRGEDIKGVIILEMIGYYSDKPNSQRYPPFLGLIYPNRGDFIGAVSDFSSRQFLKQVVTSFRKQTKFPIESVVGFGFMTGVDFSDHWSFWQEGYQAIMITDTGFYRNPHYHRDSDTYEKLDYQRMAEVVMGFRGVLSEISKVK